MTDCILPSFLPSFPSFSAITRTLCSDLANNKLKSIAGLGSLVHLKKIDLGANRIRVMDGNELGGLVNLEELWIGKNKIEEIGGLEKVRTVRTTTIFSISRQ